MKKFTFFPENRSLSLAKKRVLWYHIKKVKNGEWFDGKDWNVFSDHSPLRQTIHLI